MGIGFEIDAIRAVVTDYLEGMIWGQADRLERAFHPRAFSAGHFRGDYEFLSRQDFIDFVCATPDQPAGTPYVADLVSVEVTGDVAVARVTDSCFGADFLDILVLLKHDGAWQIVSKTFVVLDDRQAS